MFKWREGQQEAIHHTNIKRGITSSFARALKVLQQKHLQCKEDEFVYSNDGSNNLCSSLESAFLHGLKDSVAQKLTAYVGLTAAPDQTTIMNFWSVVVKFTHGDVVTQLQKLSQISTEIGLCRAWIRLALNDGLMESYLHSMIVDTKTIKYFYHSYSYMRDHEQPGILKNYLTGLMSLEFKLSCNSSVLNHWNNTTLQLTGTLDPHSTPAPAIGQTGTGSADLDPRQKNNGHRNDAKRDEPSTAIRNVEIVEVGNHPVTVSIQNVENLPKASVHKSDDASCPSLSVSEGSSSSHVSCPDIGASSKTKLTQLETKDDVDNLSENVSIMTFPDFHDHSREQASWVGTESQEVHKSAGRLSDNKAESGLNSNVILEAANPFDPTYSPSRPRSRRVGEEDMKHISSSSSSFISPGNTSAQHSDIVLSDENEDFVYTAPTSLPRDNLLHSDVSKKWDTSPEKSEGLNHTAREKQVFQSIYQGTQKSQRFESEDKYTTSIYDEISSITAPEKLEQKTFNRKTLKDEIREADKQIEEKGDQEKSNASNSSDFITQGANDKISKSCSENSDKQQEHSPTPEPSSTSRHSSEKTVRSLHVQPILHRSNEGGGSIPTRKVQDESDEQSHNIDKKIPTEHKQSQGSVYSTRREQDSPITEPTERASNTALHSNKPSKKDADVEEAAEAELMSMSPSRFGNSLNSMSGWSSEIEFKRDRRKHSGIERNRGESFATMLRGYTPASSQQSHSLTLNQVIEALPCDADDDSLDGSQQSDDVSSTRDSEDVQSSRMFFLFHVPREHGLSHQNFACKGCSRPIGIIYGPPRLCEFDGGLYCYGCHENSETYIPSSILYDWDFRKKKVCQDNYKFLQELEEQALYNVEEHNPKLFNHVPELQELKTLRQQLVYLKSYLFACSQKVAESMRQKVWPREHIYERRDHYSVMDFLQVQSGSLQRLVKDLVKFSSQHVYDCVLCSLKGFVCEICRNPQVIYPFEVDTTVRCTTCKAVYHKTCMTESLPCPKCERWGRHMSSSNINDGHPEDYGMSPHA